MVNVHSYALRLESAFQLSPENRYVTADDFVSDFENALYRGFESFTNVGLLSRNTMKEIVEHYTLFGKTLREMLETDDGAEQIKELIGQIRAFKGLEQEGDAE